MLNPNMANKFNIFVEILIKCDKSDLSSARVVMDNTNPGEGDLRKNFVRRSACWISKYLTFATPIFVPIYHQIPISYKRTPNFAHIGYFLRCFAQNTSNSCKLGVLLCDENPPIAVPKFSKKHPKRQAYMYYQVSVRTPPLDANTITHHITFVCLTQVVWISSS